MNIASTVDCVSSQILRQKSGFHLSFYLNGDLFNLVYLNVALLLAYHRDSHQAVSQYIFEILKHIFHDAFPIIRVKTL